MAVNTLGAAPGTAQPLIDPAQTDASITRQISDHVLTARFSRGWLIAISCAFVGCLVLVITMTALMRYGVGLWGINNPVAWGFDLVNFVWWIGIGHAGTLISAVLLLLNQQWRNSINRVAEAMTIFAVCVAPLFVIFHLGRPWLFYWLAPYPNTHGMWPNFRSPLDWDIFAISTYLSVSLVFWLVGMVPDFATLRDRAAAPWARRLWGMLALGWRGSSQHWARYEMASLLLAGLATPLVVSVHSIVSLDFAASQVPGWHVSVFPPYFVAGAIFGGFAMVITIMVPLRKLYGLEPFITMRHFDLMAKVMLAAGLIVLYGYVLEIWGALYSGNPYELALLRNRLAGPYAWSYWGLLLCNGLIPQLLWLARVRRNLGLLVAISLVINLGMWLERFVIVVGSLHRDFLPSAWDMYYPTIWDWSMYLGTFGLFFFGMLLFVRFLPMLPMFELRMLRHREAAPAAELQEVL
jgi:molybdopterin-containing oxidoreductase family membrane subunit